MTSEGSHYIMSFKYMIKEEMERNILKTQFIALISEGSHTRAYITLSSSISHWCSTNEFNI